MKNRNQIIALTVAVLFVVIGFFAIKTQLVTSKEKLAENVTTAVQNKDGDLFLNQFDKDSQNLKFAKEGAQSVTEQWHDHASLPIQEIGKEVADGRTIKGPEVHYKFYAESKKVLGLFTTYYLVAKPTSITFSANRDLDSAKYTLTNDGKRKRVSSDDFKAGVFPGKYKYDVAGSSYGDNYNASYYVAVSGQEESYEMEMWFMR